MSPTDTSSARPAPKKRNPIERAIVWGVILVLLILVGVEAFARSNHKAVFETLSDELQKVDSATGGAEVKQTDVERILGSRKPDSSESLSKKNVVNGANRLDTYRWFSLNPFRKRVLYLYYGLGDNPDLISVSMTEVEEVDLTSKPASSESTDDAQKKMQQMMPGMGAGGGQRPGAGRMPQIPGGVQLPPGVTPPGEEKTEGEKPADTTKDSEDTKKDADKTGDAIEPSAKPDEANEGDGKKSANE